MKRNGFTFIELIVIMGVVATITGLATINLLGSQRKASLVEAIDTLVSDIQSQQTRAMTGETVNGSQPAGFGVYFEAGRYVLFSGASYNASAPENSPVPFKLPIVATSIAYPGSTLLFEARSGEAVGHVAGQDYVTVSEPDNNETQTIRTNKYGIITSVN